MPGYIAKLLLKFKHTKPNKPQHIPYRAPQNIYGAASQDTILYDMTRKLDYKRILVVQKVVGRVLYCAIAVDLTVIVLLSAITSEQSTATDKNRSKSQSTT